MSVTEYINTPEFDTFDELLDALKPHGVTRLIAYRAPSGKWRGSAKIELLSPEPMRVGLRVTVMEDEDE